MLRSMYSGISGLKANQTKLDVIGNNIANVSTTAFKGSRVTFSTTLSQTSSSASAATDSLGGVNGKQIGLGVQIASIDKIMSQGSMQSTSRALDVAIDGEGFFMVATGPALNGTANAAGSEVSVNDNGIDNITTNTSISYTRDGSFVLDNEGNLLTATGQRVLGYAINSATSATGTNIAADGSLSYVEATDSVTADGSSLVTLRIPDSITQTLADGTTKEVAIKSYNISSNGLITAVLDTGEIAAIGQLAMASFKNNVGLTDNGNNTYSASGSSGAAIIIDPVGTKDGNGGAYGDILQGYLEMSGVDLSEQFTDMITTTKAFQAAGKMISNADEILTEIINLKR